MKIIISVLVLLGLVSTIFADSIKTYLFEGGGSWYWSSLTPYIICYSATLLLILILAFSSLKKNTKLFSIATILLFPVIQFWISPIYEGDFSDSSTDVIVNKLPTNKDDVQDGLVMLSLSGCEYCYNMLPTINTIKKRSPEAKISIAVLTTNPNAISYYEEQTNNKLNVFMVDSLGLERFSELAPNNTFPAFLYLENGKIIKKWSNKQFGFVAKDFVEGK